MNIRMDRYTALWWLSILAVILLLGPFVCNARGQIIGPTQAPVGRTVVLVADGMNTPSWFIVGEHQLLPGGLPDEIAFRATQPGKVVVVCGHLAKGAIIQTPHEVEIVADEPEKLTDSEILQLIREAATLDEAAKLVEQYKGGVPSDSGMNRKPPFVLSPAGAVQRTDGNGAVPHKTEVVTDVRPSAQSSKPRASSAGVYLGRWPVGGVCYHHWQQPDGSVRMEPCR